MADINDYLDDDPYLAAVNNYLDDDPYRTDSTTNFDISFSDDTAHDSAIDDPDGRERLIMPGIDTAFEDAGPDVLDAVDERLGLDDGRLTAFRKRRRGDTRIDGPVDSPEDALVVGDITTDQAALDDAERTEVYAGTVRGSEGVARRAEDLTIDAVDVETSLTVASRGRGVTIDASTVIGRDIGKYSDENRIEAETIRADRFNDSDTPATVLKSATASQVHADEIAVYGTLLDGAERSLLTADTIKIDGDVGSEVDDGSVIAAKEIRPYKNAIEKLRYPGDSDRFVNVVRDATIITAEPRDGTAQYTGDWDELVAHLEDKVPDGRFEDMGPFHLPDTFSSPEELDAELDRIDELYDDAVEDGEQLYEEVRGWFDLSRLDSPNDEIAERLKDLARERVGGVEAVHDPKDGGRLQVEGSDTVIKYQGDDLLGELDSYDYLERPGPGALDMFEVPDTVDSVEELQQELAFMRDKRNEVRDEYSTYLDLKSELGLPDLDGSNQERYEKLQDLEATIAEGCDWLSQDAVETLLDTDNQRYVRKHLGKFKRPDMPARLLNPFRIRSPGVTADEFLSKVEDPDSELHGSDFERTYRVTPDGEILDEQPENRYDEGLELLREIRDGDRKFDYEMYEDKVQALLQQQQDISEKIGKVARGEIDGDKDKLIDRRREIDQEIDELRDQGRQEYFEQLWVDIDGEPAEYELQDALERVAREALPDNTQVQHEAEQIAEALDDGAAETVEISVWDKDLDDLPSYNTFNCCAFKDSDAAWEHGLLSYMADPETQLLEIDRDGQYSSEAMAITYRVTDVDPFGDDYLVVDSVESGSHMFSNDDVAEATRQGLHDYAEEQGFDAILYNHITFNTAPKEFRDHVSDGRPSPTVAVKPGNEVTREGGRIPLIGVGGKVPVYLAHEEEVGYDA